MKFPALILLSLLSFSCRDLDASETSDVATIGPKTDEYVIKKTYVPDWYLNQRLSLIFPENYIQLHEMDGTTELKKMGLAMQYKKFSKNGYTHIKGVDFLPVKLIPLSASNNTFDIVTNDSNEKIGSAYSNSNGQFISELCTGSAENLCEFTYDEANKNFSIKMLPQAAN